MKTLIISTASCFLLSVGCSGDDLNPASQGEPPPSLSLPNDAVQNARRDRLTDMSVPQDLNRSVNQEDMRSGGTSDDMADVLAFEARCHRVYGRSFTLDDMLYCYTNERHCPNDFTYGVVTRSAPQVSLCSDQEASRGADDILELLYRKCEDPTRGEDCASRGFRCEDIGPTHLYDSETGTCSVLDTNTCAFQVDKQNGTSCWIRKIEGGGVRVYRGFDILPRPWEYVDSLTPGCQECRY